jgi:peptidoglycan/LPS O-acetylase OafA/YrhL
MEAVPLDQRRGVGQPGGRGRNFGLDALRALAILMVLTAHDAGFVGIWAGHPAPIRLSLAGPFGVELFFVLSGYLIGNLLLDIAGRGPAMRDLAIFLVRRWMRTLPLYLLWLLVLLVLAPPAHRLAWHALHYATLTQNLTHGMPPSDFFAVSWSLTIEEWFYLLFALCAVGGVLVTGSRRFFWVAILGFLVLPALARWQVPLALDYGNSIEKTALLNLDSIARGVLVAALLRDRVIGLALAVPAAMTGVGLIAMVWSGHWPVSAQVFRTFVTSVIGLGWALCLPLMLRWERCLHWGGAVIGRVSLYSYGLYIVHFTILEHVRGVFPAPLAVVVGIVLPFFLAAFSWHFLEAPILRLRPLQ